jgi:hypothetical protein
LNLSALGSSLSLTVSEVCRTRRTFETGGVCIMALHSVFELLRKEGCYETAKVRRCAMTVKGRANLDDLLEAIESITDEIKVLVSAVDDLRCEIEWQARNGSNEESPTDSASAEADDEIDEEEEPAGEMAPPELPDDSLLSAAGRLRAYEQALTQGRRSAWSDDWATEDDFESPAGRLVPVDADLWAAVLDVRPAHVIGEGCECEEGIGAPYLLAWRDSDEFLLRELTEEEARTLQALCLAVQAGNSARQERAAVESQAEAQLGLF